MTKTPDLSAFKTAIDSANVGFAIGTLDGEIQYVNAAFLALWHEPSREAIIGHDALSMWQDPSQALRIFRSVKAEGHWQGEMLAARRDGSTFSAMVSASVNRAADGTADSLLATFLDVSQQRTAMATVMDQADQFQALVQSTLDGFWLVAADRRILDVNEAACAMLGYSRAELLTMRVPDIEALDSVAEIDRRIAFLRNHGYDRFKTQHRRKNRSLVDVEVSVTAVARDSQFQLFCFIKDQSREKELEQAEKARAIAESTNQAKTRFLSSVTHELRTPMNSIMGFAQLLQADPQATADQKEFVGEIVDAGERLLKLINEILDLARIESGTVQLAAETVNCEDIVVSAVDVIRAAAAKADLTVTHRCASELSVTADYTRLRQVLIILLSNAVKFNKPGGTIDVSCALVDDRVRVTVADTGAGIPKNHYDQVFASFDRLGRETGSIPGSGIGLAFGKRLVELMAGTIGFSSTENVGSCFWIDMPISNPLEGAGR